MEGEARHVFVSFENDTQLGESAASLLTKGLRRGEMVVYASREEEERLLQILDEGAAGQLLSSAQVVTRPLERIFAVAEEESPRQALSTALKDELGKARTLGLAGLRVVAVSTSLVTSRHWGRWEFEVGRRAVEDDITVVCLYDANAVGNQQLGDLAALHHELRTQRPITSFRLFPTKQGLALMGEVDATSARRLSRTLSNVDPGPERRLEIDVSELTFINHYGLLAIEGFARHHQLHVRLVGASGTLVRLHQILALDDRVVRVEE